EERMEERDRCKFPVSISYGRKWSEEIRRVSGHNNYRTSNVCWVILPNGLFAWTLKRSLISLCSSWFVRVARMH
ncbi:hypothetical protein PFISCL1PPCAC_18973, partial [Pristionchus fissidentatus]